MRLIIDNLGSGHQDMFLKIDQIPSYVKTADSYYLFDFMEISEMEINKLNRQSAFKYGVAKMLDYWNDRIRSIERGQKKFIPFDLWDEYIGGFMLERTKLGFKTTIIYTQQIHGYAIGVSILDKELEENNVQFEKEEGVEWLISEDAVFNGLEWSRQQLK